MGETPAIAGNQKRKEIRNVHRITSYNVCYTKLLRSFGTLDDGTYGLALRGLRDGEGMPFADATFGPFAVHNIVSEGCYIARVEYHPPRSFDVVFSAPVDPVTAGVAANYEFLPTGRVESADPDPAQPDRVRLLVSEEAHIGALGKEYVLKVLV